jgi:hypothetical protein
VAAPAQCWAFEPVEHGQRAFDPPELLQRQVELVLTAVGREFSQHRGRCHDPGLQRGDEADSLAPMLANELCLISDVKTNLFAFRETAVVQKLPGTGATIASCSIGILAAAMLLTGGLLETGPVNLLIPSSFAT